MAQIGVIFTRSQRFCFICCLFTIYLSSESVFSAELDAFRIYEIDGSLEFGHSVQDVEVTRVDGISTKQQRTISSQELELDTQGYIYHPNLVDMELGVGVRFQNNEFETDTGSNLSEETLYSFFGNFNLLRHKPYPVYLHYSQRNPTVSIDLADSLTVEHKDYGALFSFNKPLVSYPIKLRVNHSESYGKSRGTLIDSNIDNIQFNLYAEPSSNFSGSFGLFQSRKKSGSGSLDLPIQNTLIEELGLNATTSYLFGKENEHRFDNILNYTSVESGHLDTRKDSHFSSYLEIGHSKDINSFYRYNLNSTEYSETGTKTSNENFSADILANLTKQITLSGGVSISDENNEGFERNVYGADSTIRYINNYTDLLSYNTTYSLAYKFSNQDSEVLQINKIGESHVLDGLSPIVLQNEFVVPGSIIVSNLPRTQTYVEGIDYLLTIVGVETRLERLITGNIQDGDTVLLDYGFETGGTFDYSLLKQKVGAGFKYDDIYNVSLAFTKNEESLEDGRPLRPLYTREKATASIDARYRLSNNSSLTWGIELEKESGNFRPYKRERADISLVFAVPIFTSFLDIRSIYENIDNELSDEDVDLRHHAATLFTRYGYRSNSRLEVSTEEDTGGTIHRETTRVNLEYMWRWRLLSFSLEGRYRQDAQGTINRDDSALCLTLTRDF
ncbi:MAG: hypothetical protein ABW098_07455 [Candidatus Thiodiazotropha sp.]